MPAIKHLAAACVAVVTCSCVDMNTFVRPDLPDTLGGKGAVIMEVHGVGMYTSFLDVLINHRNAGFIRSTYFTATLSPGEYVLNELSRPTDTISGGYGGVNVTIDKTMNFPIERRFTIRAGEITNLGELVLLRDPRTSDSVRYIVRAIDNNDDTRLFLRSHYPKLVAALKSDAPTLAPGDYVRGSQLLKLRLYIAAERARQMRAAEYVTGPAGTLAYVEHDRSGTPERVHLIDFGVTAGIVDAAAQPEHGRFAFETSDGRLFVLAGGRVVQRPLPEALTARAALSGDELHLAGDRNIVMIEPGLDLFVSPDDGVTWTSTNPDPEHRRTDTVTGFGADDSAYYVFQTYPPRVFSSPLGEPKLQPVALPPQMKELRRVSALDGTVVLEGFVGAFAKVPEPFFVRPRDSSEWQERLKPNAPNCKPIQFLDRTALNLRTTCGTAVYVSADGGEHWDSNTQG